MRVDEQSHRQVKMLSEVFSKKFGTYISMVDVLRMGISVLHMRLQESIADAAVKPED
jgi:hypothetical protein